MPIYEYECLTNGHVFEVQQKISDPPLATCQVCGAPVRKLISTTSFVLKGGGWYNQAYSKSPNEKASSSSKSSSPSPVSSTSTPSTTSTASTDPPAPKTTPPKTPSE